MVGKLVVRTGQFQFGHVAGGAGRSGDFAGLCLWLAAGMACLALDVVTSWRSIDIFVRIVAGKAGNALVVNIEALAVGDAVGLEAHVADVVGAVFGNIIPGAVALTAEVGALFGAHVLDAGHFEESGIALFQSG